MRKRNVMVAKNKKGVGIASPMLIVHNSVLTNMMYGIDMMRMDPQV